MSQLRLIKDYKDQKVYRKSFNELAQLVYGIDFEGWYQKGLWNERYLCYSFLDPEQEKVAANVSVNKLELIIDGEKKIGLQIGTVMTHPDYRSQGLSRKLINTVLEEYEDQVDLIYLFANETVLEFYPKFGFVPAQENEIALNLEVEPATTNQLRKLDMTVDADREIVQRLAVNRIPHSQTLGVLHGEHILTWYCLNLFPKHIYYLEEDDVIVIYTQKDGQLHLFDLISSEEVELHATLARVISEPVSQIHFHFTPEFPDVDGGYEYAVGEEYIFVKPALEISKEFKFPMLAQA